MNAGQYQIRTQARRDIVVMGRLVGAGSLPRRVVVGYLRFKPNALATEKCSSLQTRGVYDRPTWGQASQPHVPTNTPKPADNNPEQS